MSKLILFNKPYGVLSQFTAEPGIKTLADYIQSPGCYPAGRLDKDSEGLILLTDDGKLQHRIANPAKKMSKCYWVQVEGEPNEQALQQLRDGVLLKDGLTKPAKARLLEPVPELWDRTPPVRVRKTVPDHWIELTIREGKNRQVRRMTAAVGMPTLRLIRYRIGSWTFDGLKNGEWRSETV
ncbi:pseudouridine synthase [Leucothrix pacifica]|uniref:Pseudouridine synthase n=1 Tax=Leucothrix pacifica TaxID=1247513 RepID=A0A317C446_9GAMM|nr:pseudouridine synthase [Leucothrix pacifica]PWQ93049.1 pseudouridine synthase [Leucothrix pacifica]